MIKNTTRHYAECGRHRLWEPCVCDRILCTIGHVKARRPKKSAVLFHAVSISHVIFIWFKDRPSNVEKPLICSTWSIHQLAMCCTATSITVVHVGTCCDRNNVLVIMQLLCMHYRASHHGSEDRASFCAAALLWRRQSPCEQRLE